MTQALQTYAAAGQLRSLRWQNFSDYRSQVEGFYSARDWNPAWIDGDKPTPQAIAMTHLFAMSGAKGLDANDYDAAFWEARIHTLRHANESVRAAFDLEMTVCALRYVSALHVGRINPAHFNYGIDIAEKHMDLAKFLAQQVVSARDVKTVMQTVEPTSRMYGVTLQALTRYQELAANTQHEPPLPMLQKAITAGSVYAGAPALRKRLIVLGDMQESATDDGAGESATAYTPSLAEGVKSFQRRHALPASGILTPATLAELNVPLATRVLQLEDTLERIRWLAPQYQEAPVFVNIPEYLLRVYRPDHTLAFQMRVVVGQANVDDHKTPMIAREMRYIVLRPFWNVTPTITKEELAPHVEKDKGYLAAKNFEVVDRSGKLVTDWSAEDLEKNRYMVREKPGPKNSLGLVKFMFPNKQNIYLHSTPAVQLFSRTRRDYSHGCVRIQDPEQMADWVLQGQPKWTPDAIHDAMENGEDNKTVGLLHPIPVLIFYATARVDNDGAVYFFHDLYGYDADLEATLAKGAPYPVKPEPKPVLKKDAGDTA
jgi:murein L,D-transpeptidase YcbB/YkuD